jgi:hypothetical protein
MFAGPRQLVSDAAAPCGALTVQAYQQQNASIMQATAADSRVCSDFLKSFLFP